VTIFILSVSGPGYRPASSTRDRSPTPDNKRSSSKSAGTSSGAKSSTAAKPAKKPAEKSFGATSQAYKKKPASADVAKGKGLVFTDQPARSKKSDEDRIFSSRVFDSNTREKYSPLVVPGITFATAAKGITAFASHSSLDSTLPADSKTSDTTSPSVDDKNKQSDPNDRSRSMSQDRRSIEADDRIESQKKATKPDTKTVTSPMDPDFNVPKIPSSGKLITLFIDFTLPFYSLWYHFIFAVSVGAPEFTKEQALGIMENTYAQIERLIGSKAPAKTSARNRAVIICIGGALAGETYSRIRGKSGPTTNYNWFEVETDPWTDTALEKSVAQMHTDIDFVKPVPTALVSYYQKFATEMRRQKRTEARGYFWPCDDVRKNNYYIVGGVSTMVCLAKENPTIDRTQLMIEYANSLFCIMKWLKNELKGDVFYLGSGVAPDHPTLGKYIYAFHGELIRLFKADSIGRVHEYPRLYYHDIYTPLHHQSWDRLERTSAIGNLVVWHVEPKDWFDRFDRVIQHYLPAQCVASAERRYARDKAEEKAEKEAMEAKKLSDSQPRSRFSQSQSTRTFTRGGGTRGHGRGNGNGNGRGNGNGNGRGTGQKRPYRKKDKSQDRARTPSRSRAVEPEKIIGSSFAD
jgi:hypothetical protein